MKDYVSNRVISVPTPVVQQSMKEPSPLLEQVAVDNNVMISVFDYSFLDQFYSFYHNSILPLNITNFIAFALDHRTYSVHFHQERDS